MNNTQEKEGVYKVFYHVEDFMNVIPMTKLVIRILDINSRMIL